MKKVAGRCFVCSSSENLKDFGSLYTNGSEGTVLCHTCEMDVVSHIRAMASLAARARKGGWVLAKKPRLVSGLPKESIVDMAKPLNREESPKVEGVYVEIDGIC